MVFQQAISAFEETPFKDADSAFKAIKQASLKLSNRLNMDLAMTPQEVYDELICKSFLEQFKGNKNYKDIETFLDIFGSHFRDAILEPKQGYPTEKLTQHDQTYLKLRKKFNETTMTPRSQNIVSSFCVLSIVSNLAFFVVARKRQTHR